MYLIILILSAFLVLSLFATNWPVKLYHHAVLKKVGAAIGARPSHGSLFLAGVYTEIQAVAAGRKIRVRYVEGSMDALHADSGLEMRISFDPGVTIEFYRSRLKKREWGDFKRLLTGDSHLDGAWFILTNEIRQAELFCQKHALQTFLTNRYVEQILFHSGEMIIRFQKGDPVRAVTEIMGLLPELTGEGQA